MAAEVLVCMLQSQHLGGPSSLYGLIPVWSQSHPRDSRRAVLGMEQERALPTGFIQSSHWARDTAGGLSQSVDANQVPNVTQSGVVFACSEHAGEGKGRCRCVLYGDVLLTGQGTEVQQHAVVDAEDLTSVTYESHNFSAKKIIVPLTLSACRIPVVVVFIPRQS